ncbi:MAG TPA: glycosyl hydrolase [Solirubrobacterales bacterium]
MTSFPLANSLAKPNLRLLAALAAAALLSFLWLLLAPAAEAAKPATTGRAAVSESRALGAGKAPKKAAPTCAPRKTLIARAQISRVARRATARASAATCKSAPAPAVSPTTLYWGAWIGSQHTGTEAPWDMSAVSDFEAETGKPLSLIHFASPFADCSTDPCSFYSFPTTPMQSIREHGAIPFFSWSSQSTPSSLSEPEFELSDVISGRYDSYIRSFAEEAKAWGHPFFLRFDWEMNGNWFPWDEGVNGNSPGEYVSAWRHVHDIFSEVGATNATWTWCPNVDPKGEYNDVGAYYPGDSYVDWTCLDGYNWGGSRWTGFSELFGPTYHRITDQVAPSKPMIIGEVGSSENGGSKAAWISEMLEKLPTEFQKIRGVIWFDKFEEGDWPLETSASAESAFASGISNSSYLPNSFGSLGNGTVPVPG